MPQTAPFELRYGTFVAGGSSTTNYLVRRYRWAGTALNPLQRVLEADILVTAASDATFEDNCTALEDAFSRPNQLVRVILGSVDMLAFNAGAATDAGHDVIASFAKLGEPSDSARARIYRVTLAITLPPHVRITYGTFVATGFATTTAGFLVRSWSLDQQYRSATLTAEIIVSASTAAGETEATLRTRMSDLETAFRTPRSRLLVEVYNQGASSYITHADFNPATAANTGFNAVPNAVKTPTPYDGRFSRTYTITVTVVRPADLSGQNGRDDTTVEVSTLPSGVRRVTFRGTYSALAGSDARAVYAARAQAYAEAYLAAEFPTLNFELVTPRQTTVDDTDKQLGWSLTYEQIIHGESGAAEFADAEIVQHRLTVVATEIDDPASPPREGDRLARPLQPYTATWTCWIDTAADIVEQARSVIVPRMVAEVRRLTGSSSIIVQSAAPSYDPTTNALTVTLQCVGLARNASQVLSLTYSVSQERVHGQRYIPVADGEDDTFWRIRGKRSLVRVVSIERWIHGHLGLEQERFVDEGVPFADINGFDLLFKPENGEFEEVSRQQTTTPVRLGDGTTEFGDALDTVRISERFTLRFVRVLGVGATTGTGAGDPLATRES